MLAIGSTDVWTWTWLPTLRLLPGTRWGMIEWLLQLIRDLTQLLLWLIWCLILNIWFIILSTLTGFVRSLSALLLVNNLIWFKYSCLILLICHLPTLTRVCLESDHLLCEWLILICCIGLRSILHEVATWTWVFHICSTWVLEHVRGFLNRILECRFIWV